MAALEAGLCHHSQASKAFTPKRARSPSHGCISVKGAAASFQERPAPPSPRLGVCTTVRGAALEPMCFNATFSLVTNRHIQHASLSSPSAVARLSATACPAQQAAFGCSNTRGVTSVAPGMSEETLPCAIVQWWRRHSSFRKYIPGSNALFVLWTR